MSSLPFEEPESPVEKHPSSENDGAVFNFLLNNLGSVRTDARSFEKSFRRREERSAKSFDALGPRPCDLAEVYFEKGDAHKRRGEPDQAVSCFEKALAVHLDERGAEDLSAAQLYVALGTAYDDKGDQRKAVDYYERSLAIKRRISGPESGGATVEYNNIGVAYRKMGELDKAVEHHEKALRIARKGRVPSGTSIGFSCLNLGQAHLLRGEPEVAIGYLSQSIRLLISAIGEDHPAVATARERLGKACEAFREDARRVGSCPICKAEVFERMDAVACENHSSMSDGECRFRIVKTLLEKEIPIEEFERLLAEGKTSLLESFRSKRHPGRFSAVLVLRNNGGIGFEFPKPARK